MGSNHDVGTILKNGGRGSMRFELQKLRWKKVLISIFLEINIFKRLASSLEMLKGQLDTSWCRSS